MTISKMLVSHIPTMAMVSKQHAAWAPTSHTEVQGPAIVVRTCTVPTRRISRRSFKSRRPFLVFQISTQHVYAYLFAQLAVYVFMYDGSGSLGSA